MKRTISLFLAAVLVCCLGITARASSVEVNNGTATADVYAVCEHTSGGSAISVDIQWEGMNFTYRSGAQKVWDADTHSYKESIAGWEESNAKLTITNHSNTVIRTEISYDAQPAFPDTSMAFTAADPFLGSAYTTDEAGAEGIPCVVTVGAIPGGSLPETTAERAHIGAVTVKVVADFTQGNKAEAVISELKELHSRVLSAGHDSTAMPRGTVYFASAQTAAAVLGELTNAEAAVSGGCAETEINVALNKAITSFYDALCIKE